MITKTLNSSIIDKKGHDDSRSIALLAVDEILLGNVEQRSCDMPVQVFGIAEGVSVGEAGRIAAEVALESLRYDISEYVNRRDRVRLDIADFADSVSEHADHAVRQQLTAWQGTRTGATLAWIMIENDIAYTYGVGDSTLALYRDDKLYIITDTLEDGEMIAKDFFLGYRSRDGRLIPANLNRMPLQKGDIILLLSSEITKNLNNIDISDILNSPNAFAGLPVTLCNNARNRGAVESLAATAVKIHAIDDIPQAPPLQDPKTVRKSRLKKIRSKQ